MESSAGQVLSCTGEHSSHNEADVNAIVRDRWWPRPYVFCDFMFACDVEIINTAICHSNEILPRNYSSHPLRLVGPKKVGL